MADSRHRQVRKPPRKLSSRQSVLPAAGLLAIAAAAGAAVLHEKPVEAETTIVSAQAQETNILEQAASDGEIPVSRSAERAPLPNEAAAEKLVEGQLFAVDDLEIHAAAKGDSPVLASIPEGDTVEVTGETAGDWAEVIHNGLPRWVPADSVASEMPLGSEPCPAGIASEGGLQPDTVKALRAVCERFPSVTNIGGIAGRGEHATGHSIDIMVGGALGDEIALFLQENRAELGIEYLIWQQRIWRPATSNSWRGMSDRGGATANHMDHVHVTTYGNAAG